MIRAAGLAVALWMLVPAASLHAAALHRYEVTVEDSLERFSVRACFEGRLPPELVAESDAAPLFLESAKLDERPLRLVNAKMVLADAPDNACIRYRVALQPAQSRMQSGGPETRRVGGDLLTSIGDWLWRPAKLDADADIALTFQLPAGVAVSAPWARSVRADGSAEYRVGATPYDWPGVVALGRFMERRISVGAAELRLAVLDGPAPAQRDWIERWVERAAQQASTLFGRLPVSSLQVIVATAARGRGPVPWAYVARGGGAGVHYFVVPERGPKAFMRDWSATHEMSHLFLPYGQVRDAWLFEGLPTYLQNLLMARDGAIGVDEAWRRLDAGFRRSASAAAGMSLKQASARIGSAGNSQRVYWAGAGLMLAADLELRKRTSGRQTLGSALEQFAICCLGEPRRWDAQEVIEKLDALTGESVFRDLASENLERSEFPDGAALLQAAGVRIDKDRVEFDDGAPYAVERKALMPRP